MTVEQRLRETLEARASTVKVGDGWSTIAAGVENKRRRRSWFVAASGALALAVITAIVAVTVGVLAPGRGGLRVRVTNPATNAPVTHPVLWFLQLLGTRSAQVVDVDAGTRRALPLSGLPSSGSFPTAFGRGDSIVVMHLPGDRNPRVAYVIGSTGKARPLGRADSVFPSLNQDRIWLVRNDDQTIREVDLNGTETVPARALPAGFVPAGEYDAGFVGAEQLQPPPAVPFLAVWDRVSGGVTNLEPGGSFMAVAHDAAVEGADPTTSGSSLRVIDLTTLAVRVIPPPAGERFQLLGALSPDGAVLAAMVSTTTPGQDKWVSVDIRRGRVTALGGWDSAGGEVTAAGWSADGARFFFAASKGGGHETRVYAYRRGTTKIQATRTTITSSCCGAAVLSRS